MGDVFSQIILFTYIYSFVSYLYLKGHCHAIWQLYKKLEGVFESIEFQN